MKLITPMLLTENSALHKLFKNYLVFIDEFFKLISSKQIHQPISLENQYSQNHFQQFKMQFVSVRILTELFLQKEIS